MCMCKCNVAAQWYLECEIRAIASVGWCLSGVCVCVRVSLCLCYCGGLKVWEIHISDTWCVTVCVMRSRVLKPYWITTPLGSEGGSQLSHTETSVWLYMVRLRGGDMGPEAQSKTQKDRRCKVQP